MTAAVWAIGDIQGCFESLLALLDAIGFARSRDRLWLVGDLVNRGPRSVEVLRWARAESRRVTAVLGNHDLHLLGRAWGVRGAGRRDTLDEVLAAPDRDELLRWLRDRPLLHREGDRVLVHAGLLPGWSIRRAEREAERAARCLRRRGARFFTAPSTRVRRATAALTRLRMLDRRGAPDWAWKGTPEDAPTGLVPWFAAPRRRWHGTVVFGHWAALGARVGDGWRAVDSGCSWGRSLTALRLGDDVAVEVASRERATGD